MAKPLTSRPLLQEVEHGAGWPTAREETRLRIVEAPHPCPGFALDDGLTCFVGCDVPSGAFRRAGDLALSFHLDVGEATIAASRSADIGVVSAADLVIVVTDAQCQALGFVSPSGRWHMPPALRRIAAAVLENHHIGRAGDLYLRAKGLELACEAIALMRVSALTPCAGSGALSAMDTRRIIAARGYMEEHLSEALTLDSIARWCGVNRAKLTRGFRDLFGETVAMTMANLRMECARDLLVTTDLAVALIGHRSGYRSNVSFARAFSRRYGVSPNAMRHRAMDRP